MELNKIYNKECTAGLKELPEKSIHCCVTSPPYWGLRDYGTDDQLGLEETPQQYVDNMVKLFREVKRVLKDDGTLWLNLGDSYSSGGRQSTTNQSLRGEKQYGVTRPKANKNIKPKDLIGIPWLVAFALQADGWYLRQDIIWHKPNPMPESVQDRCTKSHEYIFLFSKSPSYYYDNEAIKEKAVGERWGGNKPININNSKDQEKIHNGLTRERKMEYEMRNKRSVWTVITTPYKEAHFAVYPEKLIVPCIKAGCPQGGIVLDPFMGAGTTGVVARKLNRNYIGFELNADYIKIAEKRIFNEIGLFNNH
jgi:DNA modification methylase